MVEVNKKKTSYLIFFIAVFITVVLARSFYFNLNLKPTNITTKSHKENVILLNTTTTSSNYISMRISRIKVLEIFIERDTLSPFLKTFGEFFEIEKIIKVIEKKVKIEFFYSILIRYRDRILRI